MQTKTVENAERNFVRLAGPVALLLVLACGSSPLGKLTDALGARKLVDATDNVVNATISVEAMDRAAYRVEVGESQKDPHIVGSFRASGGAGNDIKVFIMTETDYVNWANGHQGSTFYSSGQLTTSSFDVGPLAPGNYRVVFDNSFSTFSRKNVTTRVELKYKTRG
jgi:hypothetical protein